MRVQGEPIRVSGRIDRLAAGDAEVLIADYKTGAARSAQATPDSYVTQLALYARIVGAIYAGRRVRAFVVWTQGPGVVELDAAQMDAAMAGLGA